MESYGRNSKNFLEKNKKLIFVFLAIAVLVFLVYFIFIKVNSAISMVSGTEYISGEEGQVIVRLHDTKNRPLDNANCIVSLLYPDKTFFIIDREMIPTSVPGNYYIYFTTPEAPGIYEEHINCNVGGSLLFISSSFHVSTGLNMVAEIFAAQQSQYQRIMGDFLTTQELLQRNLINLSSRMEGVEGRLNQSIEENQALLLDKFSQMGGSMYTIFGNSS